MKPNHVLIFILFTVAAATGCLAVWPPTLHVRYAFVAVMAMLSALVFKEPW